MRDLWAGLVQWVSNFNKPKFVKTTKGKVGRVESRNSEVNTLSISFGRFDHNGDWIIKNIITISDSNIQAYLNKKECARELQIIASKFKQSN